MHRRDFLLRASALTAAGLLGRVPLSGQDTAAHAAPSGPLQAPAPTLPPVAELVQPGFHALRGDIGIFMGKGGTIGWMNHPDALLVIDTQFPDTAATCLAGLPGHTGDRMIDLVINTHHHPDHTSGNGVFRPATRSLLAHANVPDLQRRFARDGAVPVVADTTFTDQWRRDFGSEAVHCRYFGPAHTKGDIVIYFEKAGIAHIGDLLFNRLYPVIDRPGGAIIRHWIAVLETLHKTYPADTLYVCGHGNPAFGVTAGRDDLLVFRDYLTAVLDYTKRQIAAGKSKAEISTLENLPGFPDFHTPKPNRLASNLSVAYDELTQQDG